MARNKFAEAVTEFEKIAAEEPDNPEVLMALAGAYSKANRTEDANKKYEKVAELSEKALLLNPNQESVRDRLKQARAAEGKPEAATTFLKQFDEAPKDGGQ